MVSDRPAPAIDQHRIKQLLAQKKQLKLFLSICAKCGLCAESCFYYRNHRDPKATPAYKAVHSLGRLFKKRGKVNRHELEQMKSLVFDKCALCRRCYCPFGIDVSSMIALARAICRSQGVYQRFDDK